MNSLEFLSTNRPARALLHFHDLQLGNLSSDACLPLLGLRSLTFLLLLPGLLLRRKLLGLSLCSFAPTGIAPSSSSSSGCSSCSSSIRSIVVVVVVLVVLAVAAADYTRF